MLFLKYIAIDVFRFKHTRIVLSNCTHINGYFCILLRRFECRTKDRSNCCKNMEVSSCFYKFEMKLKIIECHACCWLRKVVSLGYVLRGSIAFLEFATMLNQKANNCNLSSKSLQQLIKVFFGKSHNYISRFIL